MIIQNTWEEIYKLAERSVGDKVAFKGSYCNPFTLTKEGIKDRDGVEHQSRTANLLRGEYELAPWEPKENDVFHYVDANKPEAFVHVWGWNRTFCDSLLGMGNVFLTRAEAEAHIPEIHEKYRKIREGKRFE